MSQNTCNSSSGEEMSHRSIALLRDFENMSSQIKSKTKDEINRLTKECHLLRAERNRLKNKISVLYTDREVFTRSSNNKIQDLEENNKRLSEENLKIRFESQQNKRKFEESVKKYNSFVEIFENYKCKQSFEIMKLKTDLDKEINDRKVFESKYFRCVGEKREIIDRLSEEKNTKSIDSLKSQSILNQLKQTIDKYVKEKNDLRNKLKVEMRKSSEDIKELNEMCVHLNERLKTRIKSNSEHKSEVLKLKRSFYSQIVSLKKQRMHSQRCNEKNKRKYLLTQKMFSKNVLKIHESMSGVMTDLREDINDLINNKTKRMKVKNTYDIPNSFINSEPIHKSAQKVMEGLVECPDCDRSFDGTINLKKHLTLKHLKTLDTSFGSNKIIDTIDLSDD